MSITRRNFLKLSGTAAAGAFFGSVPFVKGCKKSPDKLRGVKQTPSICPVCSVGCGVIVSAREGKIVNIEGDTDHPVNMGALCSRGIALLEDRKGASAEKPGKVRYRRQAALDWEEIPWGQAIEMIARRIKQARDESFVQSDDKGPVNRSGGIVFMAGANLTNEECYVFSKFARILGITNLANQGGLSHSPTDKALADSLGFGAMTNHLTDLKNSDMILITGCNIAESHPVAFKWINEAREKGASIINIDPRFTCTSSLSDLNVPIRPGTDIALINGIINYAIKNNRINRDYIAEHTNGALLINPGFQFSDGLFSGFNPGTMDYDISGWGYQLDSKGVPLNDRSLSHRDCVFQIMKRFFERYTPEKVSSITGCPADLFVKTADLYTSTCDAKKSGAVIYGTGVTEHTVGVQNIRSLIILQLLLGNIGISGGGVNPLRKEANAQGLQDHGLCWDFLPGFLHAPMAGADIGLDEYIKNRSPKTNDPLSANWGGNYQKYLVSLLKAWFGENTDKDKGFSFDWLPKAEKPVPFRVILEDMYRGKHKGALLFGMDPLVYTPNYEMQASALERLDWLVCADVYNSESSGFWKRPGVNPENINTEVFLLPAASFFEKEGSVINCGRWSQWKYKALSSNGEARDELWIIDKLFREVRKQYDEDLKFGRKPVFPEPLLKANWNYSSGGRNDPDPSRVAREINGFHVIEKQLVKDFTELEDNGATSCGNWLYSGSFNEKGNMMARRDTADVPGNPGLFPGWAWSWPLNQRVLYNRAGINNDGEPWNPAKGITRWDGENWEGDASLGNWGPGQKRAFIMLPEGLARIFGKDFADGPFPEHYEPVESPVKNLMSGKQSAPVVKELSKEKSGSNKDFPYVATLYSCAKDMGGMGRYKENPWLREIVPDIFCEISRELARSKGIVNGDIVTVASSRGSVKLQALVTDRIKPLNVYGTKVELIGIAGTVSSKNSSRVERYNRITPMAGDANTMIPELKAFLVKIEKA